MDDREQRARLAVRQAKSSQPWLFSKDGNVRWHQQQLAQEDPTRSQRLVAFAQQGDPDAITRLREYAKTAREHGGVFQLALHEFIIDWFINGKPRAKRATTESKKTEVRNRAIAYLVRMVATDFGYPTYANPEYRGTDGPMTASRIVAEELGLQTRTVEEIYRKRKAHLEAYEAAK